MLPKRARLRTFDYIGRYRYFLTFTTRDRLKLFEDSAVVELALTQSLKAATDCDFAMMLMLREGLGEGWETADLVPMPQSEK
jgi:hypothetical protein